jgi:hypothetical protein
MLIASRRIRPVLAAVLVSLLAVVGAAFAPTALAGAPATVTVRALVPTGSEGYESLTSLTQVTTTTAPVTKNGGSCSGTSAGGALELATKGNWDGAWSSKYSDYELTTIDGHSYPFGEGLPYWSFWLNNKEATVGICEAELEPGDQVLFFPGCFSETVGQCEPKVLGIEAPPTAEVGKPTTVTVNRYNSKGERSPAAGVSVEGWGSSVETDFEGHATLHFPGDETYTLRALGAIGETPKSIPAEAFVCAHTGNDGTCGTPAQPGLSIVAPSSSAPAPYTGPYPLVAGASGIPDGHVYARGHGPRVLAGTVSAHASVTSISLRLRRTFHGRCWAYNGSRARLERVRCRRGGFFQIASGGDSFSYLLPSRLPPGRYVLDIEATDTAGNHTPLDRGSSRVVFYVE